MERYDASAIEQKWQRVWEDARPSTSRTSPCSRRATSSRCSRTRPGRCTWGTCSSTRSATSSRASARGTACTSSTRRGSTRSACPRRTRRSASGVHPRENTERNIESITRSYRRVGWAYDWSRLLTTHDPTYYRWQQWQFLRFYERGLAYRKGAPVNWCPNDQTVHRERAGHSGRPLRALRREVESRVMEQWFFRITDYADALARRPRDGRLAGVDQGSPAQLDRSLGGAEILFRIEGLDEDVAVFTTRPDTLYGATFFVLAPEHELVARIDSERSRTTCAAPAAKKTADRAAAIEKTGVFTGPARGQPRERRAAARVCRRLRPDRLRNRGDHGGPRARPARLRLRDDVRAADPARRAAGGCATSTRASPTSSTPRAKS